VPANIEPSLVETGAACGLFRDQRRRINISGMAPQLHPGTSTS